jgi:hypothetical protein
MSAVPYRMADRLANFTHVRAKKPPHRLPAQIGSQGQFQLGFMWITTSTD